MTSDDFKKALKTNPNNIYILVSIDSEMVDLYVERFKNAIGASIVSHGQIRHCGKLFKHKTLNVLYMPKLDESIFERKEYIFIYTESIDKRTAVYKNYKDYIIELNNNYIDYIMKNSDMNEEQAKHLAKVNNNDLGRIKNCLAIYKDSNSCYNRFTDYSSDIYAWVDCFIKKKPLPRITESPISVMALLSTNLQNLLRVKNKDTKGMNPYIVRVNSELVNYMTKEEIIQIIGDCFFLDCQIKKGLLDINHALEYLKVRRYSYGTTN
ncbi:MAG: hypothetical protein IJZ79_01480 [Bacilli bacterium]|nr:hypothetical protein [Bacilli bacterium]